MCGECYFVFVSDVFQGYGCRKWNMRSRPTTRGIQIYVSPLAQMTAQVSL